MISSILARIGGWLALAVGALAWLKVRDMRARSEERAQVRQEQEIRNAQAALDAAEISSRPRDVVARGRLRDRHTRSS